jgi:hypothetical protein
MVAPLTAAAHQHDIVHAFGGQGGQQGFFNAPKAFYGSDLVAIVEAVRTFEQLGARDAHLAVSCFGDPTAGAQQLRIVGMVGFQGAGRTCGGAGSASDAVLWRYRHIIPII